LVEGAALVAPLNLKKLELTDKITRVTKETSIHHRFFQPKIERQ
jgi:hypothetical protein